MIARPPRRTPIAVALALGMTLSLAAQAPEGRETVAFRLTPAEGFGPVRQDSGGMVFGAAGRPGTVILTPQPSLTITDLAAWSERGIANSQVTLTPLHPGASREVPVGRGNGAYFPVQGTLDGRPVAAFLGGIFGPDQVLRLRLLAVSPRNAWEGFRHDAEAMIRSIRLEAPRGEAPTVDLSPTLPLGN